MVWKQKQYILFTRQDILGALLKISGLEHKVLLYIIWHLKAFLIKVITKMQIFPDLNFPRTPFSCEESVYAYQRNHSHDCLYSVQYYT